MNPPESVVVITPVFNDWDALLQLAGELDKVAGAMQLGSLELLVVNDGSTEPLPVEQVAGLALAHIGAIRLVELACNMGHQRAIAVGLHVAVERGAYDAYVVMDCDGEDKPEDIPRLLAALHSDRASAAVARRGKRSEGLLFRSFYRVYKTLYRALTGSVISFGNFSALDHAAAERLRHMPELWNNFASALLASRLPCARVETWRGERYAGRSKMNFASLALHGLSAISVNSEVIFIRVLILCSALALGTFCGALGVIFIRLFTDTAIPGWASDVMGSLVIVFTQSVFFFFISLFLLLRSRSTPVPSPVTVIPGYIARTLDLKP